MPLDTGYDKNTEMNFDFANFSLHLTEIEGTAQVLCSGSNYWTYMRAFDAHFYVKGFIEIQSVVVVILILMFNLKS